MPLILLFWKQEQVDDCKFKTSPVCLTSSGSVSFCMYNAAAGLRTTTGERGSGQLGRVSSSAFEFAIQASKCLLLILFDLENDAAELQRKPEGCRPGRGVRDDRDDQSHERGPCSNSDLFKSPSYGRIEGREESKSPRDIFNIENTKAT